jgi:hypothetical protein
MLEMANWHEKKLFLKWFLILRIDFSFNPIISKSDNRPKDAAGFLAL